uniref:Uncharacterized protein n=1 Tax=Cacopsylla melanoneura TaxID=428564 RepID=A0A8D8W1K6_9HEMI
MYLCVISRFWLRDIRTSFTDETVRSFTIYKSLLTCSVRPLICLTNKGLLYLLLFLLLLPSLQIQLLLRTIILFLCCCTFVPQYTFPLFCLLPCIVRVAYTLMYGIANSSTSCRENMAKTKRGEKFEENCVV